MTKENFLYSVIGVLLGFIVGFMFANNANHQHDSHDHAAPTAQGEGALPHDHPPVPSNGVADPRGGGGGPMMGDVQDALKRAKEQPDNYDAQMKAAELYYQIQRFDAAIEYLKRANALRPDSYEPLVNLGNVYFDSNRYEEAEKWYTAALQKKPDDVNVRTDLGLTFFFRNPPDVDRAIKEYRLSLERDPNHMQTLQNLTAALIKKGNAEEAQATLARLESSSPNNPAIPDLRGQLRELRSPTQ